MKIDIRIDENCPEPQIIVVTARVTEEINELVRMLAGEQAQVIAGFQDGQAVVLEPEHIVRIYAANGRVYAEAENGTYLLRLRLYEMEQRLAGRSFARISNGEIINLKKVRGFEMCPPTMIQMHPTCTPDAPYLHPKPILGCIFRIFGFYLGCIFGGEGAPS